MKKMLSVTLAMLCGSSLMLSSAQALPIIKHFQLFDASDALKGAGSFTVNNFSFVPGSNVLIPSVGLDQLEVEAFSLSFFNPALVFESVQIDLFLVFVDALGEVTDWVFRARKDEYEFAVTHTSTQSNSSWSLSFDTAQISWSVGGHRGPGSVVETVPEPFTLGLLGLGIAAVGVTRRKAA